MKALLTVLQINNKIFRTMKVPVEFDEIRPFEPEELPQAYERLLANPQFRKVIEFVLPGVPFEMIEKKMYSCKTNFEFQLNFAMLSCRSLSIRSRRASLWTFRA